MPHLASFKQRVIDEHNELAERIAKLETFLAAQRVNPTIQPEDLGLLREQHHWMVAYRDTLSRRIARF